MNIHQRKNKSLHFPEPLKERIYKNLPIALIVFIYTGLMLFLSLKYHRIGGSEVEVDFYADFVVMAKKLLTGDISPNNFALKGPVYPILLVLFKLIFGEYFRAGLIMNVLAAGGVVWLSLVIIRHLFGTNEAILTVLFSISTFAFLHYTYSVGTDMVMCLFCFLTIYILLTRKHTPASLTIGGLFACLAFLTRYNAIFLYPAGLFSIFLMDFKSKYYKKVLKNSGIFLGSSAFFGLPWYISNWIVRGSPIYSGNITVFKLHYYQNHHEYFESIKNFKDIILFDPSHFFKKTFSNIGVYIWRDFFELMDFHFSIFILVGIVFLIIFIAMKYIHLSGSQLAFFSFPVLNFATLVFVHYNIRFSYFRIPFYASLFFIPLLYIINLTDKIIKKRIISSIIFTIVLLIILFKFYPGYLKVRIYHNNYPEPEYIFDIAKVIKGYDIDKSFGMITRSPHISYYSDLRMIMLPVQLNTFDEFYEYAKENRAKFLWISGYDYRTYPNLRFLVDSVGKYPGFTPIYGTPKGILYLIDVK